jgi:hypothetical protein
MAVGSPEELAPYMVLARYDALRRVFTQIGIAEKQIDEFLHFLAMNRPVTEDLDDDTEYVETDPFTIELNAIQEQLRKVSYRIYGLCSKAEEVIAAKLGIEDY